MESNDATGNGLLNLAPSLLFDLFDAPPLNNTWTNNQGRANFGTSAAGLSLAGSALSGSGVLDEAFSAGGCLAGQQTSLEP